MDWQLAVKSATGLPGFWRMFEKSWQINTHGTRTRVRASCLEAGMGKHSR